MLKAYALQALDHMDHIADYRGRPHAVFVPEDPVMSAGIEESLRGLGFKKRGNETERIHVVNHKFFVDAAILFGRCRRQLKDCKELADELGIELPLETMQSPAS
jgi:hypothetical protein